MRARSRSWGRFSVPTARGPYQIRRMLTERTVRASDRRALFVGIDAYEKTGGIIMRDLFQQDDGGWLKNVGLLDVLVAEKLNADAEKIAADGWKVDRGERRFPIRAHASSARTRRMPTDLAAEEWATIEAFKAEYV